MLGLSLILSAVGLVLALVAAIMFFWVIALRRVVPVNEVHIVQTRS